MKILGIETSCDECSASVVEEGKHILSNIIASQTEIHKPYRGVVPELASRKHTEWIMGVVQEALQKADISKQELDGIAVTNGPGLVGSLIVGLSFAKGYAFSLGIPFVGVDHVKAHLYAPHLEYDIEYPYIGLIISGGHTLIGKVENYDQISIMGSTIDDACGEAFDKVASFYNLGYPGGVSIDRLSKKGNQRAFDFPFPSLHKGKHRYDVSYSGLKTAVVNQLDKFRNKQYEKTPENIAASFQKAAIEIVLSRLKLAIEDTGIRRVVVGGGVAANSYLRETLKSNRDLEVIFQSLPLCTDNGAMVAGLGYHYLAESRFSDLGLNAYPRASFISQSTIAT